MYEDQDARTILGQVAVTAATKESCEAANNANQHLIKALLALDGLHGFSVKPTHDVAKAKPEMMGVTIRCGNGRVAFVQYDLHAFSCYRVGETDARSNDSLAATTSTSCSIPS